jgi:Uma2 family endonuclease
VTISDIEQPPLPESMTWDEFEALPADVASHIELRDGKPVWLADDIVNHRARAGHQRHTRRLAGAFARAARAHTEDHAPLDPAECWTVECETPVFLKDDKSSYLAPDWLVHRCRGGAFTHVHAADVLLVGEITPPSTSAGDNLTRKQRYAAAGVPSYWEVNLSRWNGRIASVRAYTLESGHGPLPAGVIPLRPAFYRMIGEWTPANSPSGIVCLHPFLIDIPWEELDYTHSIELDPS